MESSTSTRRRRPYKSSSARAKEYREKRKEYELALSLNVYDLGVQIDKLQCHILSTPYSESGSFSKTLREYFSLFRFGLYQHPSVASAKHVQVSSDVVLSRIQRQEQFLHSIMDEQVMVSGRRGPSASLEQWRLYTLAQDLLRIEITRVETIYSGDNAMVKLYAHCHFRICHKTFQIMFPGALHNRALMNKFLDREVAYRALFHFQFTEDGKISSESVESDLVQGLLDAGCSLQDVAVLMQFSVISTSHALPVDILKPNLASHQQEKLRLNYVLSEETKEP